MLITDKQLTDFKALYLEHFSIELTDHEAIEKANQLLGIMRQATSAL